MTYTVECLLPSGQRVTVGGLRDTDNIAACAARCQASGQFLEIWIYAHVNGKRARGLRYDTGFTFK